MSRSPRSCEATAERTRARSGYAAAARALERAAHLTPAPEAQARRLVTAADALWHAGPRRACRGAARPRPSSAPRPAAARRGPALARSPCALPRRSGGARALLVEESSASRRTTSASRPRCSPRPSSRRCAAAIAALRSRPRRSPRGTRSGSGRMSRPAVAAQAGAALAACGRLDAAKPYLARSIAAAEGGDDPQLVAYAADSHGWLSQYPQARTLAARALRTRPRAGASYQPSRSPRTSDRLRDRARRPRRRARHRGRGAAHRRAKPTSPRSSPGACSISLTSPASRWPAGAHETALEQRSRARIPLWFNGHRRDRMGSGDRPARRGDAEAAITALEHSIDAPVQHTNWVPWTASTDLIEAYVRAGRAGRCSRRRSDTRRARAARLGARGAGSRRGTASPRPTSTLRSEPRSRRSPGFACRLEEARSRLCLRRATAARPPPRRGARPTPRAQPRTFDRLGAQPGASAPRRTARDRRDRARPSDRGTRSTSSRRRNCRSRCIVAAGLSNKAGCGPALPLHQDDRGPPAPHLPQARHPHPKRPGTAARGGTQAAIGGDDANV